MNKLLNALIGRLCRRGDRRDVRVARDARRSSLLRKACFAAAMLAAVTAGASPVYRATMTVSGYAGTSVLADFPVLVRISPSTIEGFSYGHCKANGADIAFTSADGNTVYPHEIDTWNTSGESLVWVKLPSLEGTTTTFLMTWGDSEATASATAPDTWNANYVGVWHMGEASGDCANSTSLGSKYDARAMGANATAQTLYAGGDSPVGGARQLSTTSVSSYLQVTNAVEHGSVFTVSAWIKMTAGGSYPRLFCRKSYYTDTDGWELEMNNDSWEKFSVRGASSTSVSGTFTKNFKWRYVTAVYDNTTVTVYGDGEKITSGTIAAATDNTMPIRFCGSGAIGASIDEARLMKGAASADWVKADYDTVNKSDFVTASAAMAVDTSVLRVGDPGVTTTSDTSADVSVYIACLGDGATKATVTLAYGMDSASLTKAVTKVVTAAGRVVLSIAGLRPNYGCAAKVTVENDLDAKVESKNLSIVTTTNLERYGEPGLYQVRIPNGKNTWATNYLFAVKGTDYNASTDAQLVYRRELGTIAAYCSSDTSYKSELWQDDVKWQLRDQWAYWGYFYMEAGKSYKFRTSIDDYSYLKVTDLSGTSTTLLTGNGTSSAYVPTETGYYPIEIRFGDGGGWAGGSKDLSRMSWTTDGGSTWNWMIDSGDGSLLRTANASSITLAENKSGSTLTGLTLTFPALEEASDLVAVWGATNGYTTAESWPHTEKVASLAAGATTAVYTLPSTWGDADDIVVRFYLKDASGATSWSPAFYWYDTFAPVLENVAADGTRGDKLVVTGHLADFPGTECTLKVLTGKSLDALDCEWTDLESSPHTKIEDFSLTLFESDTAAARYLKPGETCYVCVVATANDVSARSEVVRVTMGGTQATFASKSASANSSKRREYTFTGKFSYAGPADAATATKVSVWYGTSNAPDEFTQLSDVFLAGGTTNFSVVATFPEWNTTYYWQFRAEATTAGGTASGISRSGVASVTTTDSTTYTWKSTVTDGAWDDAANWKNDKSAENCLGYPDCKSAEAIFPAATTARVTLNRNFKVNQLYLNRANCDVTLVKGAEATDDVGISANQVYPHGTGSTITFDGIAVSSSANHVTVGTGVALFKMTNGAKLTINSGAYYFYVQGNSKVLLENGSSILCAYFYPQASSEVVLTKDSSISCTSIYSQGENVVVLNDSTLTVRGEYFRQRVATGGKMRFEGTHPCLKFTQSYARVYTDNAAYDYTFEFCLPEGGYDAAPIQGPANPTYRFGNHNTATNNYNGSYTMSVAEDSPAALKGRALTTPLASWPKKGMNLYAVKEGTKLSNQDTFNWSSETDPATLTYSMDGYWIAVDETFESRQWKSLELTFDAAEAERTLYVAWGPTDGGSTPGDWANSGTAVATINEGETKYSYSLPENWGSDENKVIRFYFLDGNGAAQWSQTTTYRDPCKPVLGDVTASGAATDSTAGFTIDVQNIGEEAKNLTVSVLYGGDVTALNQSQVVATKTAAGEYALTLAGLVPGSHYAVRVVVQNDWGVATTSDVFTVSTAASPDRFWNAGLNQTVFTSANGVWTKDYSEIPAGTDWQNYTDGDRTYRRELGTIAAYATRSQKYTSEVWKDQVYWLNVDNCQWCYWGCFYMEAGKSYKFRTKIDDNEYVKVTNPDTQAETVLINDKAGSASVITSEAYVPTVTGWYPIEIRFSDGNGGAGGYDSTSGYVNTSNMGWSDDSESWTTWNLMRDSGDGSRLCTLGETSQIQVAERRANGAWQKLDLTFDAAENDRDLYVAWGSAHGGNGTNGWEHVEVCATVAAKATEASYTLPENWGTDANRVIRFCFAEEGKLVAWSPSTYWHPANDPSIEDVTFDGIGGDTLVVKGAVENVGDATVTLKVLTGASADELDAEWSGDDLKGLALSASADGDGKDFSLSLFAAKDDARHFEPGSTVYACVVVLANGTSARSATTKVVMANTATLATPTATTKQRSVQVTEARLTDLGMTGKSVVTLWESTDNVTFTEAEDCEPVEVTGTEAFTMQHTFEKWNAKYYWKLRATNVSAGGTATNYVETAAQSYTTADTATYTWSNPSGGDAGSWTNAANWTADDSDCIGYPSASGTTAKFAEGAKATITLDKAWTLAKLDLSAANVDVTFVLGTNGVTRDDAKLTATTLDFSGANGKLTLDGTRLATSAEITLGTDYTLVLTNAAYLGQNGQGVNFNNKQGGTVLLSGESTLDVGRYYMDNGARTVLRDAYLIAYLRTQWWNTDGKIPVLRFEGKHPKLTQTSNWFSAREGTTANLRIEFCVPAGGYEAAPLYSTGGTQFGSYNKSGTESIYVETEGQSSKTVTTPLISWKNGIYKAGVSVLGKPKTSAKVIWADATGAETTADSPNQLNMTIPGFAGFLLIIK